jgi:hypothetical protein
MLIVNFKIIFFEVQSFLKLIIDEENVYFFKWALFLLKALHIFTCVLKLFHKKKPAYFQDGVCDNP